MANLYDLKKFDLNLLVIFECIYQHLSISKAAAMLFITLSGESVVAASAPAVKRSAICSCWQRNDAHHRLRQSSLSSTAKSGAAGKTINLNNRSELRKRIVIYGPRCSVQSIATL